MKEKKEDLKEFEKRVECFRKDVQLDMNSMAEENYAVSSEIKQIEISENSANIWEEYKEGYFFYKEQYEAIRDATFWKMTKPLRSASDWIRWLRTGEKRKEYEFELSSLKHRVQKGKVEIAVHLHLFYEDLLDEFCDYLNNIPEPFDLYISCKKKADILYIKKRTKEINQVKNVHIKIGPNRGRDIAPFYVLFGNDLKQYEYLLHIHTKKSLYTGEEKKTWRQWALNGVIKDETSTKEILAILRNKRPEAGLIFGEMTPTLPPMALHWLYNSGKGKEILDKLHIKFENHMLFYPVGSFFWARTKAILPLFEMGMTYEDFDEETGQIDGTLAHALERVVACVARGRGYDLYIFDPERDKFSKNKSYKCFDEYFNYNVQNISELIQRDFDVVSFDIFDTLITRVVYEPDDIFRLMERIIQEKYGRHVNYLALRKQAEEKAYEEKGDFCNIYDIYNKMPDISCFEENEARELCELEVDLELELCMPRKDILEIYRNTTKAGKKVILISDMYLTSDIISKMLTKCGYDQYDELWVSCEKGKRKDKDTIWEDFFSQYDTQRTLHIGDNPHSDYQVVGDRGKSPLLLLSPIDQFRLSTQYEKFEKFVDSGIENSLVLGFFVNICLYNSPFALGRSGGPTINNVENLVQGIFAPILLKFSEYLHNTSREDGHFLFLSREGFFIEKLYEQYCAAFGKKAISHSYFLTSRRATSVAQIRTYRDAKELLETEYSGKLSTLMSERFGLTEVKVEKDVTIQLPAQKAVAVSELERNASELLRIAEEERKAYFMYMKQELGTDIDWSKIILVDVGYSGTIQYYLMKILRKRLDGCYLVSAYTMKPDRLDGTYRSLYSFWKNKKFEKTQLFLEAVMAAPHGQVLNFAVCDNAIQANMKSESDTYGKNGAKMQQQVYEYVNKMGEWTKEINPCFSKELAETIFFEILRPKIIGDELHGLFMVNDGYCMDGNWVYDEKESDWIIEQDGKSTYLKKIHKN